MIYPTIITKKYTTVQDNGKLYLRIDAKLNNESY